jgi:lysyl-tRNA synthetase class I
MYNRKYSNKLPRINSKVKIVNNLHQSKNIFPKMNANMNQQDIVPSLRYIKEKKPGTSNITKKPIYILPEIPIRKLSKTANIKTNDNNSNNNDNNNYNKDNYTKQNENQINDKMNNVQNYYEKYENVALFLLKNDDELKNMFNELNENNSISDTKKWIEENLLQREVFWTMLEFYVKKKLDVNRFIKREIHKLLNNKILDNTLAKSLKMIQFQYNEYINNIHNL